MRSNIGANLLIGSLLFHSKQNEFELCVCVFDAGIENSMNSPHLALCIRVPFNWIFFSMVKLLQFYSSI